MRRRPDLGGVYSRSPSRPDLGGVYSRSPSKGRREPLFGGAFASVRGRVSTEMLARKVAVITGAGRGIGASAAKLLGREGARVVVNDLDQSRADDTAEAIVAAGGTAIALAGSIVDRGFPERLLARAAQEYGPVDVLVNNAGFLFDGVLHKMGDEQWDSILEMHLTAPFRTIRAAAPYMREAAKREMEGGGVPSDRCIINVSSTSGLHGNAGQANYAAAKAGIVGLTKTVAREWGAFGVRANVVAFGMIDTRMTQSFADEAVAVGGKTVLQGLPAEVAKMWEGGPLLKAMVPLNRKGRADEAAGGILFLASPLASYVTGHTLEVTGGMGI
jgi:3-oxoacyl-[acyl-carrier protein] reductase